MIVKFVIDSDYTTVGEAVLSPAEFDYAKGYTEDTNVHANLGRYIHDSLGLTRREYIKVVGWDEG